jgi:hypothetical protein
VRSDVLLRLWPDVYDLTSDERVVPLHTAEGAAVPHETSRSQ